ncbi:MAG TPA: tRNA (adenosine(37)-N6)-dimethylallyltransferase MiaA [Nitrospirae bacterium]|nr:tRNA dimethylallyltransferase [bacterium BMS3Abin10]GBE37661.1 tRNA dimethylallyltransferase [bacterium BMS3Bbin08]HDH50344.1 tRNA (adenosine(37)-N6)-dimethylallyltransferase MiaA [Nitrospirota bacterium]HDK16442.1 tRNA (adenosine(37)-N6)-dimethylallyltransferase MiaA [Nitrospirota bacterium]HDK82466.1 tRNA (adenosine(37)-N6)-dimethylallyltransferase MiaA [Nitrospirota bacterium]
MTTNPERPGSVLSGQDKPVVIVAGPTGVGKTSLSILLARALDTEIISADSMQIYCGMDIGTSKPSDSELKEVRHHLINILSPAGSFSAGMFKKMATEIIGGLHSRSMTPVVVGGTGLYIKTLTTGLFEGPEADWTLREKLLEEERSSGEGHLYERLKQIDPVSAGKISRKDTRRVVRALEVALSGSKPISELQHLSTVPQPYSFIKIGLSRERKELYRLIEQRVDVMMEKGLLRETEKLLKTKPGRTALQALGYKEMQLYMNGITSLEESVRLLKKRTKMYAKRQFTWFKKERHIRWIDITGMTDMEKIFKKIINDVAPIRKLLTG